MVVEENVQSSHCLDGLFYRLDAVLLLGQVGGEEVALSTVSLDLLLGLLRILLFLGQVGDEGVGALHGEQHGRGSPDAAVSAGDDGFLAPQLSRGKIFGVAAFGGRHHLGGGLRIEFMLGSGRILELVIGHVA